MHDDHCRTCGVSKQQVLAMDLELVTLIKRAAPFVNAVAAIAAEENDGDPGPALGWIADAAARLSMTTAHLNENRKPS